MKLKLITTSIFCILIWSAKAQHHQLSDIPKLTDDNYRGKRDNESFQPVKTNVRIYYRLDSIDTTKKDRVSLKVITKVEVYSPLSFFDRSGMSELQVNNAFRHEQGRLLIGYIVANQLEKKLSAKRWSKDYAQEVKTAFYGDNHDFSDLQQQYDAITNYGNDLDAQKRWEVKLTQLFNKTLGM